jgi:hypothetical protein
MTERDLIEQLADKEHASWARWMDYLISTGVNTVEGNLVIPAALALQWRRQADTPYTELTEREKQSDRDEVAHILPIIRQFLASSREDAPSPFKAIFDA